MTYDSETLEKLVEGVVACPDSVGDRVVIGIDGCGGAGKSTLATLLAERLPDSQIVPTDDFASWEEPLDWWQRVLREVFWPLRDGTAIRYQRYNWTTRTRDEWVQVTRRVLLLEGVNSTRREFRPYLAARIWVDCPRTLRLERGLLRDGPDALPDWQAWMAAEDGYVSEHRPQDGADYVIRGYP